LWIYCIYDAIGIRGIDNRAVESSDVYVAAGGEENADFDFDCDLDFDANQVTVKKTI